jgi:hypothetical protein
MKRHDTPNILREYNNLPLAMRARDGRARSALWCLTPPMIVLGNSTDVGRRTGIYLTILTLCSLAGLPISGTIYRATGGYSVVGIYPLAGRPLKSVLTEVINPTRRAEDRIRLTKMMVAVVLLASARYFVLRWRDKV